MADKSEHKNVSTPQQTAMVGHAVSTGSSHNAQKMLELDRPNFLSGLLSILGTFLVRGLKLTATLALALTLAAIAGVAWLAYNPIDAKPYEKQITAAIDNALPENMKSSLSDAQIGVGRHGFTFKAKRLSVLDEVSQQTLVYATDGALNVKALPLLRKKLEFSQLKLGKVVASQPLQKLGARDVTSLGITQPGILDKAATALEQSALQVERFMHQFGAKQIVIGAVEIAEQEVGSDIEISSDDDLGTRLLARLFMGRADKKRTAYDLDGALRRVEAGSDQYEIQLQLAVPSFDLFASAIRKKGDDSRAGEIRFDGTGELSLRHQFSADPAKNAPDQEIAVTIISENNSLKLGEDEPKLVSASDFKLNIQRFKDRIALEPSFIQIGSLRSEIMGAVQLSSLSKDAAAAGQPVFEIISNDSVVAVPNAQGDAVEQVPFGGRVRGSFSIEKALVEIDSMEAITRSGTFLGSGSVKFVAPSPSVVVNGAFKKMELADLLAIWPEFIAKGGRKWLQSNVIAATLVDGKINAAVPPGIVGRLRHGARLEPEHLDISLGFEEARIRGVQEIPNLIKANGKMSQIGPSIKVNFSSGELRSADNVSIAMTDSTVLIEEVSQKPLRLATKVKLSGDARALGELANSAPINAFKNTQIVAPADFSGQSLAIIEAVLEHSSGALKVLPDWKANLTSDTLQLSRKIDGRTIKNADISADIDRQGMHIIGTADIDGLRAELDIIEKFDSSSVDDRKLSFSLDAKARKALGIDLGKILKGVTKVQIKANADGSQDVIADLTKAELLVPGTGWTKGAGIPSKASFNLSVSGNKQTIKNLEVTGGGLRAKGSLRLRNGDLQSLKLSNFGLNKSDKSALSVDRQGGEYVISFSGETFDMRPFLAQFLSTNTVNNSRKSNVKIKLIGKVSTARGFNDELLTNVTFGARGTSSSVDWVSFDGFTTGGATVKLGLQANAGSGDQLSLSSSDIGAFLRFTDIYTRVRGGSAAVELVRASDTSAYVGAIRARKMKIVDEKRLSRLVNSRAGGERSLNESLRDKIQTEVFEFDELVAEVALSPNELQLNRGVIRGPVVGSTFSGTVFDINDGMQLKGVFIPAYGVNQLVSSLPIIGQIFGNAQSGGFLGISWSLKGAVKDPKLEVNPISIFTPGVFREIFNQG